jgi:hypothetical protein
MDDSNRNVVLWKKFVMWMQTVIWQEASLGVEAKTGSMFLPQKYGQPVGSIEFSHNTPGPTDERSETTTFYWIPTLNEEVTEVAVA